MNAIFSTAGRYLAGMLLKRIALTLFGLSLLLVLFDTLNNSDTVEKKYGDTIVAFARYMAMRLPEMLGLVTPFCILVSALLTLLGLAAQNEALAFKAAGMSFYRMLLLLMPAVTLIAGFHFLLADVVIPAAKRELSRHELERPTDDESLAVKNKSQAKWMREGPVLVQVIEVQREGRVLNGVTFYLRDVQGNLVERMTARSARWRSRQWTLVGVTRQILDVQAPRIETVETLAWQTQLRPSDFFNLAAGAPQFTSSELRNLAQGNNVGTRPSYTYETWFHRRTALPAVAFMMLLLAAPVAQARVRNANLGLRLAAGIGLGFLFFVTDGLALAMGESGAILPLVSAWAPVVTFASVAGSVLLWIEGL